MTSFKPYLSPLEAPGLQEVQAWPDLTLLEFGTDWCGHCRAAQPAVAQALLSAPDWAHVKVEDGSGRALGRAFRVKLWPTLVFLRDGQEICRLVRPTVAAAVSAALVSASITPSAEA
jgi:thioredoxin 1